MAGYSVVMAKKRSESVAADDEARVAITVRLPRQMIAQLDAYIATQRFPPPRQGVIEKLLDEFLKSAAVAE